MNSDGYPTKQELAAIRKWSVMDLPGYIEYLKEIGFEVYGLIREDDKYYYLSTGGWSGNESIIGAMESSMVWMVHWYRSERGGHYMLEKRKNNDS